MNREDPSANRTCGPPGMTAAVVEALQAAGLPRRRVHVESFEF